MHDSPNNSSVNFADHSDIITHTSRDVFQRAAKLKVERELYERLKSGAASLGYATVDEFVTHLLEKAVADTDEAKSEDAIRKRLQGLGYIE